MDSRRTARISRGELERRWAMVREQLAVIDADALVTITSANEWGSGMSKWLTGAGVAYRRAVMFNRDDLMTVVEHGPMGGARRLGDSHVDYPGVDEAYTVAAFPAVNYTQQFEADVLVDACRRRGHRRIALHNPGGMLHGFLDRLKELAAEGVEFVDATDAIDECKAIRSEEEIALLHEAGKLQDAAFQEVLANVRPGMYDFEVSAIAEHYVRLHRGHFGVFLGSSAPQGPEGKPAVLLLNENQGRQIEPGDVYTLLIENGSPEGLYVELARTMVFGEPSNDMVDAFELAKEAQAHTFSLLKPGARCSDVYAAHRDFMVQRGVEPDTRLYCHGQGHDLVERPLVRSDETMVIRAGMNIAAHPAVVTPTLFATVCDNAIIRDDGIEPLHHTDKRLFQVSAG